MPTSNGLSHSTCSLPRNACTMGAFRRSASARTSSCAPWHRDGLAGQQARYFRRRRVYGGLKCYIAWNHNHRDAAVAHRLPDRDLQNAGHLFGPRDQLTIVTALLEQHLRMGFLEISGAELGRRDLRRNGKHRYARPLTIEQAIDQVQIARAAAPGADRKLSCQMRFGTGRESRDFLVPYMHPFYLALATDRIGQSIQAVADDAIYPLHTGYSEGLCKLVSNCFGHDDSFSKLELGNLFVCLAASQQRRQADQCSRS